MKISRDSFKGKSVFVLLVFPFLCAAGALLMKFAAGPFWLGENSDPSYIYLISSLHILDGIPPVFIDHPGTTLQLLGAGVFRVMSWGVSAADLSRAVLADPEFYLHAVYGVLWALFAGSVFALGWAAFRKTRDLVFALCLQSSGLLFLTLRSYMNPRHVLPVAANVNSDTLILAAANVFLMVMVLTAFDDKRPDRPQSALFAGLAGGLGVTTKFSFLPLLMMPLLVLRGIKNKLLYLVTLVGIWLTVTLPIMPRYGKLFGWVKGLVSHKGFHGSGGAGVDWGKYGEGMLWLVRNNALLAVTLLAAAVLPVLCRARGKDTGAVPPGAWRLLTAAVAAGVLQFVLVAKQTSPHYMAPGLALSGLLVGLSYLLFIPQRPVARKIVILFLAFFTVCRVGYAGYYYQKLKSRNHAARVFSERLFAKNPDCAVCGYYRSSSIPIALDFGNDCFGLHAYSDILSELYPDCFFYNYWTRQLHDFHDTVSLKAILARKPCVLLYGSGYDFSKGFFVTEQVAVGPAERVERVLYSTADAAVKNYLLAKMFEAKRDYRKALGFAGKAHELNYPKLEPYLQYLLKQIVAPGQK